jgi:hypothetical protein
VLGSAFGPVALAFGVLALPGAGHHAVPGRRESITLVAFVLVGSVIAIHLRGFG